ncbi:hypothetical protein SM8_030015 [Streptomyces sp. SM8]|nr:hypothetical protein SM8_030015 [Streptomyces sp. SM8]
MTHPYPDPVPPAPPSPEPVPPGPDRPDPVPGPQPGPRPPVPAELHGCRAVRVCLRPGRVRP